MEELVFQANQVNQNKIKYVCIQNDSTMVLYMGLLDMIIHHCKARYIASSILFLLKTSDIHV